MDVDNEAAAAAAAAAAKQCFTPIQNRMLSTMKACQLCPSMDLVAMSFVNHNTNSLAIHRTVSWQRLANLTPSDWTDADDQENDASSVNHIAWSPDGRFLALGFTHGVVLYQVEKASDGNHDNDDGALYRIPNLPNIIGVTWAHVARPHPSWMLSHPEVERELTWKYQSRYFDRSATFLPPSSYHTPAVEGRSSHHDQAIVRTSPSCQTPLSLLCVATADQTLHLYLHGRYLIGQLPITHKHGQTTVCSSDLTHLMVLSNNTTSEGCYFTLYSMPALAKHRYTLQIASALYGSITSHLQTIQQCTKETLACWKSALKPLDTKLEALVQLLQRYGVSKSIRQVLSQYIQMGHDSADESISNALDQFFAHVQMNDQLIQRLERSLHSAVANVETVARRGLLSPARSLVHDAGGGELARMCDMMTTTTDLPQASQILYVTMEALVARIVESRVRLQDLVAWLRQVASHSKARATPPQSVQWENAKKRRVPDVVIQRMIGYLQQGEDDGIIGGGGGESITENLLGISITDFFCSHERKVHLKPPLSPTSVSSSPITTNVEARTTPTIPFALKRTRAIANELFEQPRASLTRSMSHKEFLIPTSGNTHSLFAMHTRIGCDNDSMEDGEEDEVDNEPHGYFRPALAFGEPSYSFCRNWAIVAQVAGTDQRHDNVQLYAIPLGWKADPSFDEDLDEDDDEDDDFVPHENAPFYLTSRLILPSQCTVKEIAFYGDDGRSSISSGADSGAGKEGRQAIGMLLSCPMSGADHQSFSEELWLFPYESVLFRPVMLPPNHDSETIVLEDVSKRGEDECVKHLRPLPDSPEDDDNVCEDSLVWAKTRRISIQETESLTLKEGEATSSRLMMSGSRGVGGVCTAVSGNVVLNLFDLEEDDDNEDE